MIVIARTRLGAATGSAHAASIAAVIISRVEALPPPGAGAGAPGAPGTGPVPGPIGVGPPDWAGVPALRPAVRFNWASTANPKTPLASSGDLASWMNAFACGLR